MLGNHEKSFEETDLAFAVAVVLLNASVLVATFSIGWLSYWLIKQSVQLESFLRVVQVN